MARYWQVGNVGKQDSLLAAIRDAGEPISAREAGRMIGISWMQECKGGDECAELRESDRLAFQHVRDGWDVASRAGQAGCHVLPLLRSLERRGLLESFKEGRSVFWRIADDTDLVSSHDLPPMVVQA